MQAAVQPLLPETNIVLIGMPGVGKSTVGLLLAKMTSRDFLDTDVYIQTRERRRLQDIIDRDGIAAFCRLEERYILGLDGNRQVIATGGSVVYSEQAMRHLGRNGRLVHLRLPIARLEERLTDADSRGIVRAPGQDLRALYAERLPLYECYAETCVETAGLSHEQVVARVLHALRLYY